MYIYSYNPHSKGAKALANALGIRRIKHTNSRFTGRNMPVVINWGTSQLPDWQENCSILNPPQLVNEMSNKLSFFQVMDGYDFIPRWTTDKNVAREWGTSIVCRHVLTGHSGNGIEVVEPDEDIPDCPLYVQYVKKKDEYRIHMGAEDVIDWQKKGVRKDAEDVNYQVRNHANGFVYMRDGVDPPDCVLEVAQACYEVSLLDFGAFDVIYNAHYDRAYVLEVNTAPGLEGQTVESYATMFREYIA